MRAALGARPGGAIGRHHPLTQRAVPHHRAVVVVQSWQRRSGTPTGGAGGPAPAAAAAAAAAASATATAARGVIAVLQQQQPHWQQQQRARRPSLRASAASAAASAGGGAGDDDEAALAAAAAEQSKAAQLRLALGALALSLAALAVGLYYTASAGFTAPASAAALKAAVAQSPLGRSGLLPAFSLIFLSEVGDKTFFIAALLAMKLGRAVAFLGSMAALATMTAISVLIGALCSRVPEALRSSLPLGEVAGTLLLVVFGVRALREAMKTPEDGASAVEEELADAREVVEGSAGDGAGAASASSPSAAKPAAAAAEEKKALGARLFEVATLIFLAEWGDRSMLATVALGAAQSPWAVAIGATAGHAAATAIAVVGGALAGARVSERAVNATSGVLFLLFAAATLFTAF